MMIQNNKISLSLQNTPEMERLGVSVPMATEGGVKTSSVEVSMDCTVQKDMGSTVYTEADAKQWNVTEQGAESVGSMSPADFISRCMTGEDAQAVSEEETPLEEYTSSQVERTIQRVKENRRKMSDSVNRQVEDLQEEQRQMEEAVTNTDNQVELMTQIQRQLVESNLPVTGENLSLVSNAFEMAVQGQNMSEAGMIFFIEKEMNVTPEAMKESAGAEAFLVKSKTDATGFEEVQSQIEERLAKAGLTANEENMEQAKWLYENHLPVTPENVVKLNQIKELAGMSTDKILARVSDQLAQGVAPAEANLGKMSWMETKRQLEETRLSMTIEAARTMSAKGIELDVSNLVKIVDELKMQEEAAKNSLVEEFGMNKLTEAPVQMQDTLEAVKQIMSAPVELLARTIQTEEVEDHVGTGSQPA